MAKTPADPVPADLKSMSTADLHTLLHSLRHGTGPGHGKASKDERKAIVAELKSRGETVVDEPPTPAGT